MIPDERLNSLCTFQYCLDERIEVTADTHSTTNKKTHIQLDEPQTGQCSLIFGRFAVLNLDRLIVIMAPGTISTRVMVIS